MDSRLIYNSSEKLKLKIDWIKPAETEWIYCGAAGEVKWNVVAEELNSFFDGNAFYVATTRTNSFQAEKEDLLSSIYSYVGKKNFIIWEDAFQRAVEFNQIGVFRKGIFNASTNHPSLKMSYNKLAPGLPDKVKGKLVKYKKGDCLSLDCGSGKYLAVFIAEKFNKYYDFTLLEFYEERKPVLDDFVNGHFFGCYGDAMEKVYPATERLMLPCLEVDANPLIEKVGLLELIDPLAKASYGYRKDIAEVLQHYIEDLPQRKRNTENFDKRPNQLFISNRLIEIKNIAQVSKLLTQASQTTGGSASAQQNNSI